MAQRPEFGAFTVAAVGKTVTAGAASASTALPVCADSANPRYIRVSALNPCYIKVGVSTVAATANDILINHQTSDAFINVTGCTHIAYIRNGSTDATLNIVPLEDM